MFYKFNFKVNSAILLLSLLLVSLSAEARPFKGRTIQLPLQKISSGTGEILLDFILPHHHEFAHEAPSTVWVRFQNSSIFKTAPIKNKPAPLDLSKLPHRIPYEAAQGKTVVVVDLRAHFCDKDTQVCLTDNVRVKFPLRVEENAANQLPLTVSLQSPISV
ncbi:MAG TPA: hypothetical protein DIS66_00735 [Candidatus Omnitrophica bacterium]|nr:hypothetical protein [Candidatus Omnitrophota bacterium]